MSGYKAIYRCRLCQKEFEDKAYKIDASEYPTASVLKHHKCADGRYGVCDLQGTYEVKE